MRSSYSNISLTQPPLNEPVSIVDVKTHLMLEHDLDDSYITTLITVAREWCENRQNRAYITQKWVLSMDRFPCVGFEIPKGALQSVDSIRYKDYTGLTTTLTVNEDYVFSTRGMTGRVMPAYGKDWPSVTLWPLDAVEVEFTCGYGDASKVPMRIKQAMLLLIGHWYENRMPLGHTSISREIDFAVSALLEQDRIIPV